MLVDTIIGNPDDILPKELLESLEVLANGNNTIVDKTINQIESLQKDQQRLYALLFLYELKIITLEVRKKIFSKFISDSNKNIQFHMVLFSGMYNIEASVPNLQLIRKNSDDLIQCTALWALTKFGHHEGLINQIIEKLTMVKDDRAITLLAASLYLLNNDKNSYEMLLLKDYFLNNFFDEERHCLNEITAQSIDFSPHFMGYLLWQVGYKFITIIDWNLLNLNWLIS